MLSIQNRAFSLSFILSNPFIGLFYLFIYLFLARKPDKGKNGGNLASFIGRNL